MPISLHISSIQFSDGSVLQPAAGDVIVIVGPNNSGKSASLRAIHAKIENPESKSPIINSVELNRSGTLAEMLQWIERRTRRDDRPGDPIFRGFGQNVARSSISAWWTSPRGGLHSMTRWLCRLLSAEQRITAADPPGRIALTREAPSHPLHLLEKDDRLENKLSGYFKKAFGTELILHRGAGGQLPLLVGDRPQMKAGQDRVSFEYLQELEKLPELQTQGDGMRSFTGILLETFLGEEPIVLIDEPEAFLHPPQARLLGRMLAQKPKPPAAGEEQTDRQIIVATHSADVLRGVLSIQGRAVRVTRITRSRDVNVMRMLDNAKVLQLWNDPLLRFSNILDGLFHERVVLCEADGDCRFYSAVADALYAKNEEARVPDVLYTHCGGKARLPMVIRALREVAVPVFTVTDFDILNDASPLREVFEASGGTWQVIEQDWRVVKTAVDQKKPELMSDDLKKEMLSVLEAVTTPLFPAAARTEIEKILKRSSPWSIAKTVGKAYVPNGDASAAVERLLSSLRAHSIHVVETGELESFARTVGGHGPAWVNEVLKKDLSADADLQAARDFVHRFSV